ncbi:selenocysteine-specific elongation factor-like [Pollicipes pollicipes]|uniref:selenocysteine-specific elongation factor-like n=1 Tax=Pollicipes pollicipes TaxID=41117 RepID=UPI0018855E25|nr:selenocysteine-specific elongation factor-like [Pollicipes pollicipes]
MAESTLNFNVGVLGHIDSGKTSLARALSSVASTASFDKNPQSQERGITIDLGFSSFSVPTPERLSAPGSALRTVQFTLVDCPGHASLIRTIIGGAQIIDLMLLVVDVTKGMQTQTAECLVIGGILCRRLVVVLNKTDLVPEPKRAAHVEKMSRRLRATLQTTRFRDAPVVALAARPGGAEGTGDASGVSELVEELLRQVYVPQRSVSEPLVFSVDHCFSIRGQGTVMTGTVLQGSLAVNQTVEIPALKVTKKVKSLQMFRRPVERAIQGDRVGVCVTQFDPKTLERGLVAAVGYLPTITACIIQLHRIDYFRGEIRSKSRFHVTLGHDTAMARMTLFARPGPAPAAPAAAPGADEAPGDAQQADEFDAGAEYAYLESLEEAVAGGALALLELERPVTVPPRAVLIGSKLDMDVNSAACRLAFHGRVLAPLARDYTATLLPGLRVYKDKSKAGTVERLQSETELIVRDLLKKESNVALFSGLAVQLSTGERGVIEGGFGQSGKVKVRLTDALSEETRARLSAAGRRKAKSAPPTAPPPPPPSDPVTVELRFKRYVFDPKKRMVQS